MNDGTLMIENIQGNDLGTFECIARSDMGEVKSRRALVNAQINETSRFPPSQRPRFLRMPIDQEVAEGQRLIINCSASGFPSPTIRFKWDQKPISQDSNTEVNIYNQNNYEYISLYCLL